MIKKDDLYIAIIKYGADKLETGVRLTEIQSHIEKIGHKVTKGRLERIAYEIYIPLDDKLHYGDQYRGNALTYLRDDNLICLSVESKFRLVEHIELQEARKSSNYAMWAAIIAIVISIITGLSSIYYSKKQIETSTTIDTAQFEKIKGMKVNSSSLDSNLHIIIEQQEKLFQLINKQESQTSANKK